MAEMFEKHLSERLQEPEFAAAYWKAERDDLAASVARVGALHVALPNSVSAMYPTPLCSCGHNYPCPTIAALRGESE